MQFTISLKAGKQVKQQTAGSYFLILDDGGSGAVVDITFRQHAHVLEEIRTAKRGTKARMASGQFTLVEMTADRDCTLEIIISDGAVDVDYFSGANINATIAGPHTGTLADPIYVATGTTQGPALAMPLSNVAVTSAGVAALAANANRVRASFFNTGTQAIALGPPGVTFATAVLIVQPGDTWVEDRAANLAWTAITAAGTSSTLNLQEVTV